MKGDKNFARFVRPSAVAVLDGCASTNHPVAAPVDATNHPPGTATPAVTAFPPTVFPVECAFQKLDVNTNGVVTLDEWRQFDTTILAANHFNTLDEDGNGQISAAEFQKLASKHPVHHPVFGGTNSTDQAGFPPDPKDSPLQGWELFSIQF